MVGATFGGIYQNAQHDKREGKYPVMRRTGTVDYTIVPEGEICAILDDGETLVRTRDALIQRITKLPWAKRSDKTARITLVLVEGRRYVRARSLAASVPALTWIFNDPWAYGRVA